MGKESLKRLSIEVEAIFQASNDSGKMSFSTKRTHILRIPYTSVSRTIKKILLFAAVLALATSPLCIFQISLPEIVINEVMFNPFDGDAGSEWIELYNKGEKSQNLKGWSISNREGTSVAELPAWDLPNGAYLVVWFSEGTNDCDFSDGNGTYYTGPHGLTFDNAEDEIALYKGSPGVKSIVDFVSWCADNDYNPGKAHEYAVTADIWTSGAYLDVSFATGTALVLGGESIGRNKDADNNHLSADWSDHGGIDAYLPTPGAKNAGPLFDSSMGIKFPQLKANLLLMRKGRYMVTGSSSTVTEMTETEDEMYIVTDHTFTVEKNSMQITFEGTSSYRWCRISPNLWKEELNLTLKSTAENGEIYDLAYAREWKTEGLGHEVLITEKTQKSALNTTDIFEDTASLVTTLTNPDTCTIEATQDLNERGTERHVEFTMEETNVSNSIIEGTTYLGMTSTLGENVALNTHYERSANKNYDVTLIFILTSVSNLYLMVNATYNQYDLTLDEVTYSLSEPGECRIQHVDEDNYHVSWMFKLANPEEGGAISAGEGDFEIIMIDDEEVMRGILTDNKGNVFQFYIDGAILEQVVLTVVGFIVGQALDWIIGDNDPPILVDYSAERISRNPCNTEIVMIFHVKDPDYFFQNDSDLVEVIFITYAKIVEGEPQRREDSEDFTIDLEHRIEAGELHTCTYRFQHKKCDEECFGCLRLEDGDGNFALYQIWAHGLMPKQPYCCIEEEKGEYETQCRKCPELGPPNIKFTFPKDGDTNIPVNAKIVIEFCKRMDTDSVERAIRIKTIIIAPDGTPREYYVGYTEDWNADKDKITLTPRELEYKTKYTVEISTQAESFWGFNLPKKHEFSFFTEEIVVVKYPDLIPRVAVQPADDIYPGDQVTFTITVTNQGEKKAEGCKITLQIPLANTMEKDVIPLDVGQSVVVTFNHIFQKSGTYRILVNVDPYHVIPEPNRTNNKKYFDVYVKPLPDLYVSYLRLYTKTYTSPYGIYLTQVDFKVKNNRGATSEPILVYVYLDGRRIIDHVYPNGLQGGKESELTTYKVDVYLGTDENQRHVIKVEVDPLKVIRESNEDNVLEKNFSPAELEPAPEYTIFLSLIGDAVLLERNMQPVFPDIHLEFVTRHI